MTVRISWDRYEVALLFDTYERVAGGSDTNSEAVKLSESLRTLATRKGISIDETYRNVNGMKMQLANVQYLFTRGQKGLSGASTAIRQMYELYRTDYTEYQMILKEAIRLTGSNASIEDAFFAYTKKRMRLSPDMIADYMQKAAAYCHLKQPLLGMADVKAVRNVQQKVAEGKLLRFQYGKDAQTIRSVAQLYYAFIKSYRAPQEESSVQKISAEEQTKAALDGASDMRITDTEGDSEHQAMITMEENNSLSPEIRKRILSSVSEYFPHGIRPASIIDINKLKRVYQSKFGEDVPADLDMVSLLMSGGLKSGEKVHFLSEDQQQSLRNLIMDIIRSGHRVIYYSELLSLHGELFEACHIYESPLMKTVLQSILPGCIYKAEWLLANQKANEIEEITEVFGADVILTYQQLKNRCPYLTMSAIKLALSRSDRFVWSSPETYAQVDLIELDPAEISDIVNRIFPLIREEGYFSLAQLPIEESCGLNPQVSSSAVRDAIYNRYMSNEFTRNGLIVKRQGIHLTTYQLMETWLKGLDQVTLTEVEDYERELTGHHAMLGIIAASNTMVRIDHDHYVSDASIQFNVDAVDYAISLFAGNRIIPITAITSYTSFPDVPGYNWNLYLVESFLRRFSKRFTIDGSPAQMSYVGGISSADRHFANYEDRLAHAVIQDGITLTEEAIGRYLTERKYILRRSETVRKTLDRARILNEQRGDSSVWI